MTKCFKIVILKKLFIVLIVINILLIFLVSIAINFHWLVVMQILLHTLQNCFQQVYLISIYAKLWSLLVSHNLNNPQQNNGFFL